MLTSEKMLISFEFICSDIYFFTIIGKHHQTSLTAAAAQRLATESHSRLSANAGLETLNVDVNFLFAPFSDRVDVRLSVVIQ